MNSAGERLYNGLIKENPTFVLMLGMCPTLAVTTSAMNGLGMGLTTMVVLALSNMLISLLRKIIPNRVRIPAFIVIIASFVTMVQLLLEAFLPELNKALGVYIPLIVVNCIILGRAESYAYFNGPIPSLFDGIGMGLGFSFALTCIGAVRELLSAGEVFGFGIMPESYVPVRIFGQAPGAFFVLACLVALQNYIKEKRKAAGKPYEKIGSGCSEDCMNCSEKGCTKRFYDAEAAVEEKSQGVAVKAETDAKTETAAKTEAVAGVETNARAEATVKAEITAKAETTVKVETTGKAEETSNSEEASNIKDNVASGNEKKDLKSQEMEKDIQFESLGTEEDEKEGN